MPNWGLSFAFTDINDNAPMFPQGVYYGNVTENGTSGNNERVKEE